MMMTWMCKIKNNSQFLIGGYFSGPLHPGSGNNISMEYIASMLDPTKTHEYAWDELVLQLAMMEVTKIQKQYAKPVPIGGVPKFWISGPFALLGVSFSCFASKFSIVVYVRSIFSSISFS
jgi:hypothetical protein